MTTTLQLLAVAALAAAVAPAQEKEQPLDAKQIAGAYRIESGEKDGAPIPAERLRDHTALITADRFVVSDADEKELYASTYKLTGDAKGGHGGYGITMTTTVGPDGAEGEKAAGLIKLEGDTLTLIYSYGGGAAPTEFKTKEGARQNLFVLKKVEAAR